MKLFNNYSGTINEILTRSNVKTFSNRLPNYIEKGILNESNNSLNAPAINSNKVLIEFDKSNLETLFGRNPNSINTVKIGTHPDFENINHTEFENHYCVSMFMDIVGSTRLNEKYTLLEIRKIKDTILSLAINVANHFGGHIHRLQGDGIMIQFVNKGLSEQNSVINALNTSSVLTNFISKDLAEHFQSNGIKPLRVRIGIDLGYKEDVIWSHYGVLGCSELTTTSLHTDLAGKLQSQSKSNGILIGSNVRDILDIKPEFCENVYNEKEEIDYYIYQSGLKNYRKYNFNWINYLNSFDFTKKTNNNNNLEVEIPKIRLRCFICDGNSNIIREYFQNSDAIRKVVNLKYIIFENDKEYHRKNFETIEWIAINSGQEAKNAVQENHDFQGNYKNKTICETSTAYKGHHIAKCTIKREHSENIVLKFPIFVE